MKTPVPWKKARAVADELCAALAPACEKIAIVGSIRRCRPFVNDIELLFIPKVVQVPDGLFETKTESMAEMKIENWIRSGLIAKRPSVAGGFSWGDLNKLAVHVPSGIPLDLFATTKENWFVSLVIRTGSKQMNLLLTTGAQKQGGSLNAYGSGVTHRDGTKTPATSEQHVFQLCGVPYREPRRR